MAVPLFSETAIPKKMNCHVFLVAPARRKPDVPGIRHLLLIGIACPLGDDGVCHHHVALGLVGEIKAAILTEGLRAQAVLVVEAVAGEIGVFVGFEGALEFAEGGRVSLEDPGGGLFELLRQL